jgi:type II secretory pathway component PulC
VYVYRFQHFLDRDKKKEQTEEYFYKDIVGLSTSSKESKTKSVISFKKKGCGGKQTNISKNEVVEQTKFCIKVPGDQLYVSMKGTSENDNVVQAMKAKLREKKNG